MNGRDFEVRASIGHCTSLVLSMFGLEAAEGFREQSHGLRDDSMISLGDVERYLGRDAYLRFTGLQ